MAYVVFMGSLLAISMPVSTGVLALGLWILADENSNPFQEYGTGVTWAKCAGLVIVVNVVRLVSSLLFLSTESFLLVLLILIVNVIVWFGGVMFLFGKTAGQAILLATACWFLGFLLERAVNYGLGTLGHVG